MSCSPLIALAIAFLPVAPSQAEHHPSAAGVSRSVASPSPTDDDHDQRRPPTADELLEELQRTRPLNEIIPSAGARADGASPPRTLLPEGWSIVDQTGAIRRTESGWELVVDENGRRVAYKLLPNATLDVLVRTTTGADHPVRFTVSGELTVYRGENYLLARTAMRSAPQDEPAATEPAASPPGDSPGVPVTGSAGDVLDVLRNQEPDQRFLRGDPIDSEPPPEAPRTMVARIPTLKPDGAPLVARPARIIAHGSTFSLALESDHPDSPDPPLELLPCRTTQRMADELLRDPIGLVFIVSGEITLFDGTNHLLPRVAVRQLSSGNLRK